MRNLYLILAVSATALLFQGCGPEDVTKQVSKDGSIETELSVLHLNDSLDVLTTKNKIWVKGKESKLIVHKDTIPSLGVLKTDVENEAGDKLTVPVKKDYEFYVTVK